jgi:23S rRNA (adenine2030-N6)-methyltransferase
MFSYRHAFHAGSHADVLKHCVVVQLLNYMRQKAAPFMYIDTHAGAGLYALESGYAAKSAEYQSGIARLWHRKDLPQPVVDYLDVVQTFNPDNKLRYYPGSPFVAESILRLEDRLRLFELHPSEIKILQENVRNRVAHQAAQGQKPKGKRMLVMAEDGFDGLKALLPPQQRRALVLIDPSYEDKRDYKRVKEMLADALQRFASGVYAIWYPILQRQESRELAKKLIQTSGGNWLHVTLSVSQLMPDGFGLSGSGLVIINPPWILEAALKEALPYLVKLLGKDNQAKFTLETGHGS